MWTVLFSFFLPFLYCRVWTISSYLQTHFLPLWWFISGDVIKLLNLHSFLWNIGRNVKSARESEMNGRIAISVVEQFTQWMQRAWCQQPCVCTTKQSADIGNDGGGTLQYTSKMCAPTGDWLTLVESALVDMGWCKARAIKVYPMKEPNPGESDKRIIFNEQVDKFTRYKLSSGLWTEIWVSVQLLWSDEMYQVHGTWYSVKGTGYKVQGTGCKVRGMGCKVQCTGYIIPCERNRVLSEVWREIWVALSLSSSGQVTHYQHLWSDDQATR